MKLGFLYAACGPLVRSSYKAGEVFLKSLLGTEDVAAPLEERILRARENAAKVREHAAKEELTKSGIVPVSSLVRSR
jgi:lipoic acid synthetase